MKINNKSQKRKKIFSAKSRKGYFSGFTLIELIIVVTIIGILAAVVSLEVMNNQAKSRDSRRIADITTLYKAVLQYKNDNNEAIPAMDSEGTKRIWIDTNCDDQNSNWSECSSLKNDNDFAQYMPTLPEDPINKDNFFYGYANKVDSDTIDWYVLLARLETTDDAKFSYSNKTSNCFVKGLTNAEVSGSIVSGVDGGFFEQCN